MLGLLSSILNYITTDLQFYLKHWKQWYIHWRTQGPATLGTCSGSPPLLGDDLTQWRAAMPMQHGRPAVLVTVLASDNQSLDSLVLMSHRAKDKQQPADSTQLRSTIYEYHA